MAGQGKRLENIDHNKTTMTIIENKAITPDFSATEQHLGELIELPQWIVWRSENRGGPKPAKMPYQAVPGHHPADSTDPKTWRTYQEAQARYQAGGMSGIGFVFSPDDPYCGVDLDDCILDPTDRIIAPWATTILQHLGWPYTEVSPSGTGLKSIVRAAKPGKKCRTPIHNDKKNEPIGEIEIYDRDRYFAITGAVLPGDKREVKEAQAGLEAVYFDTFPKEKKKSADPSTTVVGAATVDDQRIIDKASKAKNGADFTSLWTGQPNGKYGSPSEADLALCNMLAFWTGPDEARIDQLFRSSGLYRGKWDEMRGDLTYGEITIAKALEGRNQFYEWKKPRGRPKKKKDAPKGVAFADIKKKMDQGEGVIFVNVDEHRVVNEAVDFLSTRDDVYQRNGSLVRVTRDSGRPKKGITRPEGMPKIEAIPQASLQEILSRCDWYPAPTEETTDLTPIHPPKWAVAATASRGSWPGIPYLEGVVNHPILRPDGSIFQTAGYDPETCLILELSREFPPIPDKVSRDDGLRAMDDLLEVVVDFPFALPVHRSAWVAATLTPFARNSFDGPSPLNGIDASTSGSGKTLLTDATSEIVCGRDFPRMAASQKDEEIRKRITSLALEGTSIVLIDNIAGTLDAPSLDAALTGSTWQDRILCENRTITAPLAITWYATGNNIVLGADTARRTLHIRLEPMLENPEERSDFRHPDLLSWVRENRPRLVSACLTILKSFIDAGRPDQRLKAWGSFMGWSRLIRDCIVWLGQPDPGETRQELASTAQTEANALRQLIYAWMECGLTNETGVTAGEMIKLIRKHNDREEYQLLKDAILEFAPTEKGGELPNGNKLGKRLAKFRRKVVNLDKRGYYIDNGERNGRGTPWLLHTVG